MAADKNQIDSPAPGQGKMRDLSGLKARIEDAKDRFKYDGAPRKGAASDIALIQAVGYAWYAAEGKNVAASDREAVTLAFSQYWALYERVKG